LRLWYRILKGVNTGTIGTLDLFELTVVGLDLRVLAGDDTSLDEDIVLRSDRAVLELGLRDLQL